MEGDRSVLWRGEGRSRSEGHSRGEVHSRDEGHSRGEGHSRSGRSQLMGPYCMRFIQ